MRKTILTFVLLALWPAFANAALQSVTSGKAMNRSGADTMRESQAQTSTQARTARGAGSVEYASPRASVTPIVSSRAAVMPVQSRSANTPISARSAAITGPISARSAQNAAQVSRAAAMGAISPATSARAAQGASMSRAGTARATALFTDVSKMGGTYATCRESYNTCMDQFCGAANDTYRRCICSDKYRDFSSTESALTQAKSLLLQFQDNNLNAVNLTAAEVNAMYSATVGEAAIKKDTSESAKILAQIDSLLSGKSPPQSYSSQPASGSLGVLSLDFSADLGDIWGGGGVSSSGSSAWDMGDDNITELDGVALYNKVNSQCTELAQGSCENINTLSMVRSAYSILIGQDCTAYEKNINKQKEGVAATVRQAYNILRDARLEEYRAHNSADVNECIAKVQASISSDNACGAGYRRCLDYTGRYINTTTGEPIYSTELYRLSNMISLGRSAVAPQAPNRRTPISSNAAAGSTSRIQTRAAVNTVPGVISTGSSTTTGLGGSGTGLVTSGGGVGSGTAQSSLGSATQMDMGTGFVGGSTSTTTGGSGGTSGGGSGGGAVVVGGQMGQGGYLPSDVLSDNVEFSNFLDSKRMFAESALNTCRDKADLVWTEFKRMALIEIAQAQSAKVEEVKSTCVTTIKECYDTQTGALASFDSTTAQLAGALSATAARAMCSDKVAACASLYSTSADTETCTFDNGGRITNADKCGLGALLSFVNTVDSITINEGCQTAMENYVRELCTDASRPYPYGCRLLDFGTPSNVNSRTGSTLYSVLGTFARTYCVVGANPDDPSTANITLPQNVITLITNYASNIQSEMSTVMDSVCTEHNGVWLEGTSTAGNYTVSQTFLNNVYGGRAAPAGWGTCVQYSAQMQCGNIGVTCLSGGRIELGEDWYRLKCVNDLAGAWNSTNKVCSYAR